VQKIRDHSGKPCLLYDFDISEVILGAHIGPHPLWCSLKPATISSFFFCLRFRFSFRTSSEQWIALVALHRVDRSIQFSFHESVGGASRDYRWAFEVLRAKSGQFTRIGAWKHLLPWLYVTLMQWCYVPFKSHRYRLAVALHVDNRSGSIYIQGSMNAVWPSGEGRKWRGVALMYAKLLSRQLTGNFYFAITEVTWWYLWLSSDQGERVSLVISIIWLPMAERALAGQNTVRQFRPTVTFPQTMTPSTQLVSSVSDLGFQQLFSRPHRSPHDEAII